MNNLGQYEVRELGKRFFVVFAYTDGDFEIMSNDYGTKKGAEKRMKTIKTQAGA